MSKMKVTDFICMAKTALESHTVYGSGAFGASIGDFPSQATRYYDNTLKRCGIAEANKLAQEAKTKPCFAFDCVGLPKGILFGFDASEDRIYGGATYESNGVPDFGTDVINKCSDVSEDFKNIIPGELLWLEGHVGIYIGNALAIECTTAWTGNVLQSVVTNIRAAGTGEHGRKWAKHGKLPYVDYGAKPEIVCPCCGSRFVLQ